ncbi:helix-turn-helix transcriptional regulator, partial [Dermabacter sp. HMSC06F07]|uniref:helix-turn-helix domain-containing protein n=1 Tax=Dermabacter sp. HMSC06F07 TaxID=1581125 RepID=UPI0009F46D6C
MSIQPTAGAVPEITLAQRLRIAREFAGLEQTELSERAQISRATISASERGRSVPSRSVLTLWAFACGVDRDWLRTGHKNTPSPDGEGVEARPEGFEPPT